MKSRTNVGQIYLTHPKDENYASVYEEAFAKHGQTVELFAVLEVAGSGINLNKLHRTEYENLTQTLVTAFKRTYVTAAAIDQETFEKALAAINAALSRLVSHNKGNWYGKLNAAVGAIFQNRLMISTSGTALVYLIRKGELNLLSEDLAESVSRPIKIFSNYASGRLADQDRIILSTAQLINYLSLNRIREFLNAETLDEACQEIISAVADIKTVRFATFICEITSPDSGAAAGASQEAITQTAKRRAGVLAPQSAAGPAGSSAAGKYAWAVLRFLWNVTTGLVGGLFAFTVNFFRHRPRKYLFAAIGIVLLLLVISVGSALWKKSTNQKQVQQTSTLTEIEKRVSEAEGALIYKDESKATSLIAEAEKLLSAVKSPGSPGERKSLEERLQALKNKVSREVRIDNPTILTTFPSIPTDLVRSPNGFLGFNRNSQTVAFYDFRVGATKTVLKNQNTGKLLLAAFLSGGPGFVFLDRDGKFETLDIQTEQLTLPETANAVLDMSNAKIQGSVVLGEASLARIYLLDTGQNQIWKVRLTDKGFQAAERWITTANPVLSGAVSLAVDGNIYVLYRDRVDKYFNGQKQNFDLSPVTVPLKNATQIFTLPDQQFLYVLDPDNKRILVFNKQGKFSRQIISPKFRDLTDVFVDEKNKIIYALSGSELLQVNF